MLSGVDGDGIGKETKGRQPCRWVYLNIRKRTYMNKIPAWFTKCNLGCGTAASLFDFKNPKYFLFLA
jgi:hypothetical protein